LLALQSVEVGGEVTRCGFVTSKRIGNAVTRNRVRRRLREVVRRLLPRIAPGRDLVFVARPAAAQADLGALRAVVEQLLTRARLLATESTETPDVTSRA
jgi:ribonuclease P protein component